MEVDQDVASSALVAVIQKVLAAHEGLERGAQMSGEQPRRVEASCAFDWVVVQAATPQESRQRIQDAADQPFDLAAPPLVRGILVRGEPDRCFLVLVGHRFVLGAREPADFLVRIQQAYHGAAGPRLDVPGPDTRGRLAPRHQQQLAFWKSALGREPPVTALPGGRSARSGRTYRDGLVSAEGPQRLQRSLSQGPPSAEGIPEVSLLAAFSVLIARYAGQQELILGWSVERSPGEDGSPVGRTWENWLPLLIDVDPETDFGSHVEHVGRKSAEALTHGDIPFTELVRELQVPRSATRPSLIQVLFELRQQPDGQVPAPFAVLPRSTPLDLHLVADRRGDRLDFHLTYNADLLEAQAAEQLLQNFLHLADSALAAPDQELRQLPLLTPDQRRRVVEDFNRTDAYYPSDRCLHELIAEQAAQTPEAYAYLFEDRAVTYAQVDGWANAIARELHARGLGRGDFVSLLMDRSLELPVAMLGVIKSGAAYVPMDVHWPAARIEQIVADSARRPLVLLTPGVEAATALPSHAETLTVRLDGLAATGPPEVPGLTSDDAIYMIYTSGSTGKPKGTVNRHRGIVNRLTYMNRRYGCGPEDVILQTSAHIFDASVWQFFWPLINGRPSILPSPMVGFDYQHITELIERHAVTVTDFVPSVFNLLVDFLKTDEAMRERLATVRQVLIGGEALSPGPSFRFQELCPGVGITNTYGPTETSIGVIFYEVGSVYEDPLPIGRPIDNVKAYILDEVMQPVPIGVAGMLYLGGECVGLGYHNDPEKTAAAFPETPFPEVHPGRLYNTGDLARFRQDGTIEFLGRADHQIKIRGLRVELGEIEAALGKHPDLQSAVVTLHEAEQGRRLAAYAVAAGERVPSPQELRAFLKERIPEYIVPHSFTLLDELPLMRSGKVDRRALPEPAREPAAEEARGPGPRTATEEAIARAWREEIGLDFVSLHDNFFELGGDSLGVVKVALRLEEEAGLRIEAEQMMIQSLGQLAAASDGGTAAPEPGLTTVAAATIQPRLFGLSGEHLYGCLHQPQDPVASAGVVVCPPLGHEHIFTHRALKHTAQKLAESGVPVLRFDYLGTGDSAGESEELTLAACVESIQRAGEELRRAAGVEGIYLVGLRLGGSLAAMAAPRLEGLMGAVLWDPVAQGQSYLDELARLHRGWLGGRAPGFRNRGGHGEVDELLGFPVTRVLYEEIGAIDIGVLKGLADHPLLWIDSTEEGREQDRAAQVGNDGDSLTYRSIPYPEIWNQNPYKARLPHGVIEAATEWIRERAV